MKYTQDKINALIEVDMFETNLVLSKLDNLNENNINLLLTKNNVEININLASNTDLNLQQILFLLELKNEKIDLNLAINKSLSQENRTCIFERYKNIDIYRPYNGGNSINFNILANLAKNTNLSEEEFNNLIVISKHPNCIIKLALAQRKLSNEQFLLLAHAIGKRICSKLDDHIDMVLCNNDYLNSFQITYLLNAANNIRDRDYIAHLMRRKVPINMIIFNEYVNEYYISLCNNDKLTDEQLIILLNYNRYDIDYRLSLYNSNCDRIKILLSSNISRLESFLYNSINYKVDYSDRYYHVVEKNYMPQKGSDDSGPSNSYNDNNKDYGPPDPQYPFN